MAGPPPTFPTSGFNLQKLDNSKLELAFEEGHDADIPSNTGIYDPNELHATASHNAKAKTPLFHHAEHDIERDAEKGPSGTPSNAPSEPPEHGEKEQQATDPNIVWWENEHDRQNPMNWSESKKWANIGLLSFVTFVTYSHPSPKPRSATRN